MFNQPISQHSLDVSPTWILFVGNEIRNAQGTPYDLTDHLWVLYKILVLGCSF
jgi:hypothetical protein